MSNTDMAQLRLLIVDDQLESRRLLRGLLSEIGITQIFEAEDGKTGLSFLDIANDFVDIILCDWNMPGMTGIDFLRQIRSAGIEIPFIMITGRSDHGSVIEARGLGVDGYIRKPYSPDQIEAKIRIVHHRKLLPQATAKHA